MVVVHHLEHKKAPS